MRSDLPIFDGLRKRFLWSDLIFFEELSFSLIASLSKSNFFLLVFSFFNSSTAFYITSILFCCIILYVVSLNCFFKLCSLTFTCIFSMLRWDKLTTELEISPSTPTNVFKRFFFFFLHQKAFLFPFHAVFHLEQYLVFFFALHHIDFVY